MKKPYSERRRVLFWNPLTMESPSEEAEITISRWLAALPTQRGRWRWVLKTRGMYATGRGAPSLSHALIDFAQRLRSAGAGEPAGELARLSEHFRG